MGSSEPLSDSASSCAFLFMRYFLLYIHPDLPRSVSRVFVVFVFELFLAGAMSSQNSCEEDYATRRRRELERDVNQWDVANWTTEDGIAARRTDMDRSVEKEIKATQHQSQGGHTTRGAGPSNPTFVGSVNVRRAFSHNMQGAIPGVPDLSGFPEATEAIRVTDKFCDQYRVLRREVEILQEENDRLRRMLARFLTPITVIPPSPPRE